MADGTQIDVTKSSLESRLEIPELGHFEVVQLRLVEGLSERTYAEVEIAAHEDLDWSSKLLEICSLSVEEVHTATRLPLKSRGWKLRLGEARFVEHKDSAFRFVLKLHDPLWPLSLALDTRKFRNMSAQAIVSKILDEQHIAHEFRITQKLAVRKYTAQYRETKLAFIERLMEFEGIYYFVDDDGTVVFADESKSSERLREGAPYELIEAADGMARGDTGLHALSRGRRLVTGSVTAADYNWKKPLTTLRENARGEAERELEIYEFPAGYREIGQGQRIARLRCDAYRAQARYLDGKGNETGFAPGKGFAVAGLAAIPFAGEYLVVHVEHYARIGAFAEGQADAGGGSTYENRFRAMPLDVPFRPMPKTPRPTISGSHTAVVRGPAGEEIHTDEYGRFRAQLHWDREAKGTDEDSRWMRLMQETSSSMVIARSGWEVMVGYVDGDPDRPMGLGRTINGQMLPTYGLPSNKNTMSIKTPSSPATGGFSEIKMDDSGGSQLMAFRAEKDFDGLVKNDKSEKVGHNETHEVTNQFKREIHGSQFVTIGGNDSHDYGATSELKVGGNRDVFVAGSETVKIDAGLQLASTKGESEKVGVVRLSVVGSIKIPDFKKMAKDALASLNPIAAIKAQLKNPFDGLLGKIKEDVKSVEQILKDPKQLFAKPLADIKAAADGLKGILDDPKKNLLAPAQKALQKQLQDAGKDLAKAALDKAKAAFKEEGLSGALKAGWGSFEEGAKALLEGLPEASKKTVLESLQKSIGPKVQEMMKLGGIVELPEGFKLDGPGGLLPSMEQLESLYGGDKLLQSFTGYVQDQVGSRVQEVMTLGGLIELPKDFKLDGPGGVLPSMEQLQSLYGGGALPAAIQGYIQQSVGGQVTGLLTAGGMIPLPEGFKLDGFGGFLPSIDNLKQLYSIENLKAGLVPRLDAALNQATGGLYDSFFPKGANGQRAFELGWDQVDKLIDMFTTGGMSKTAKLSIKVIVGGATVKAAIGPIEWGSKAAWMETIGGMKFTRTPVQIDQDVKKKMTVTVIGKALRSAEETITVHSDGDSSITVKARSEYDAGKSVEVVGVDKLSIDVDASMLFDGGGSTIKITTSSVKLDSPKVGLSGKNVVLLGTPLKLA